METVMSHDDVITKPVPSFDRAMKTLQSSRVEIRKRDAALYDLMELWCQNRLSNLEKDRALPYFYKADAGLIGVGTGVQKAIRWDAPASLRDDLRKYRSAMK